MAQSLTVKAVPNERVTHKFDVDIVLWELNFDIKNLLPILQSPPLEYEYKYIVNSINSSIQQDGNGDDVDKISLSIQSTMEKEEEAKVIILNSILSLIFQLGDCVDGDFNFGLLLDGVVVDLPNNYQPKNFQFPELEKHFKKT